VDVDHHQLEALAAGGFAEAGEAVDRGAGPGATDAQTSTAAARWPQSTPTSRRQCPRDRQGEVCGAAELPARSTTTAATAITTASRRRITRGSIAMPPIAELRQNA